MRTAIDKVGRMRRTMLLIFTGVILFMMGGGNHYPVAWNVYWWMAGANAGLLFCATLLYRVDAEGQP